MNELYEKFLSYEERFQAFNAAFALMGWDDETLAPRGARELSGKLRSVLFGEYYNLTTCAEFREIVMALSEDKSLSPYEAEIVRKAKKDILNTEAVPKEVLQDYQELSIKSWTEWEDAKEKKDFTPYRETLGKMIRATKNVTEYKNFNHEDLYDVLLNEYEEGFTQEVLDEFFGLLRSEIVPLLKECEKKNASIRTDFLRRKYDIEKQKEFSNFLAGYIGFDFNRGVISEYQHPFTTNLHKDDVRITTSYVEDAPESAMFSTVHEAGHAMFEQDNDDKYTLVPAASYSCGTHESQSRLYENMIARNRAFWEPIYGKLQALFPENLSDVTMDEWVKAINKPQASLIRTESDELTYCLHILVRYEMEKEIFGGQVRDEELADKWNRKYEEILGVRPGDDAEGILQDVHWSQGMFGYFPSYAIGNAIAAQIYATMDREINVDECLRTGALDKIHAWLDVNIHKFGGVMKTQDLLKKATGEAFNPHYYVDYLKEKFTKLYE